MQAYEASHHAIDTSGLRGLAMLKHLLDENGMTASDLARVLGVHLSMGSKILKGERSLTIEHVKQLAARFRVNPSVFIDGESAADADDRIDRTTARKALPRSRL